MLCKVGTSYASCSIFMDKKAIVQNIYFLLSNINILLYNLGIVANYEYKFCVCMILRRKTQMGIN